MLNSVLELCVIGVAITSGAIRGNFASPEVDLCYVDGRAVCVWGSDRADRLLDPAHYLQPGSAVVHRLNVVTGEHAAICEAGYGFSDLRLSTNGRWFAFFEYG